MKSPITKTERGFPFKIVFEDKYYLVLDKPSGMHCVALKKSRANSVARILLDYFPELQSVSKRAEDAGLVNRLDFETSGLLFVAKSREAWEAMHQMLTRGEVKKEYEALVEGKVDKELQVSSLIGSKSRSAKKVRVYTKRYSGVRALPATTRITPIKFFPLEKVSLVKIVIEGGRRHQIRVHCKHLGNPLVGDKLYGGKTELLTLAGVSALAGICCNVSFYLRAATASFTHPLSKKKLSLSVVKPSAPG